MVVGATPAGRGPAREVADTPDEGAYTLVERCGADFEGTGAVHEGASHTVQDADLPSERSSPTAGGSGPGSADRAMTPTSSDASPSTEFHFTVQYRDSLSARSSSDTQRGRVY